MDILTAISEYKNHLKAAAYAAATIDSYRKNLDLFSRYLAEKKITDFKKVGHQTICDYQAKVAGQPVAMETKALKIRPVKRLFEHLVATHRLLINPCDGIVETCRTHRKIGTVLTIEEVKKLLAQPNLSLRTGIRDRAVMEVFYCTGIRLAELLSLDVHHADLADKTIYIRKGKGNKQRVVPLGSAAIAYLKAYLKKIRPHHGRKQPRQRALFLLNTGAAMTAGCIRQALKVYRMQAGIKKSVSPHTFRRTCATHLLRQGADIRYIQELLGHENLKTTAVYTKVMPVEVKQTHSKTHPEIQL